MYSRSPQTTPHESNYARVASNSCYDLLYSANKNRIYFVIKGFWKNRDAVPEFIRDWRKALQLTRPNFTILTDMSSMITHPQELNELHAEAHKLVMNAGVARTAHVLPTDKIASLQAKAIAEKTGMAVKNCTSVDEADDWLNHVYMNVSS